MAVISIPLTQGKFALIDEEDLPLIQGYSWYAQHTRGKYYACALVPGRGKNRRRVSMHRLILGITDPQIRPDHRDGNSLNNVRSNLRRATRQQNSFNLQKQKTATSSRYKGVCRRSANWEARIRVRKQLIHLGMHVTEEGAARAYDAAAIRYFGEFAALNFPENGQTSALGAIYREQSCPLPTT